MTCQSLTRNLRRCGRFNTATEDASEDSYYGFWNDLILVPYGMPLHFEHQTSSSGRLRKSTGLSCSGPRLCPGPDRSVQSRNRSPPEVCPVYGAMPFLRFPSATPAWTMNMKIRAHMKRITNRLRDRAWLYTKDPKTISQTTCVYDVVYNQLKMTQTCTPKQSEMLVPKFYLLRQAAGTWWSPHPALLQRCLVKEVRTSSRNCGSP